MILVLGKSALSVPDTRFSRVSGSTLVKTQIKGKVISGIRLLSQFLCQKLIEEWTNKFHYPRVTQAVSRRSKVVLHNKSYPDLTFYLIFLWFGLALKKETPCFHRPGSILIDSPLPQGVSQPVSRRSDAALKNKSPPKTHMTSFVINFGSL